MSGSIYLMFPTAVGSYKAGPEQHKEFKERFLERMPHHCAEHENGGLYSGEASGKVYLHTDEVLEGFFRFVSEGVGWYLDQLAFDKSRVDVNIVKTWISATHAEVKTPVHAHATSHLSFVYYMNMPKEADAIAFQIDKSPNEPYYAAFMDGTQRQKSLVSERNAYNSNQSVVRGEEGELLIFPSTLFHSTVRVGDMGKEMRIALAGDVILVYNEREPNYATGVFDPSTWRCFR